MPRSSSRKSKKADALAVDDGAVEVGAADRNDPIPARAAENVVAQEPARLVLPPAVKQAVQILLNASTLAQSKGVFSFGDSAAVFNSITTLRRDTDLGAGGGDPAAT